MQWLSPEILAMKSCKRAGFTLIELLVVISIISLLIALLLPALGKSRTNAHAIGSLSNVRQLHIPLYHYASDNKFDLPYVRWPGATVPQGNYSGKWSGGRWPGVLYHSGYITSTPVFWSAMRNTSTVNLSWATTGGGSTADGWAKVGYGLVGDGGYNSKPAFENFDTSKPMPARTISLVETWRTDAQLAGEPRPGYFQMVPWHTSTHVNRVYTYNKRAVRAYYDGHASSSVATDIGWNPDHAASTYFGNYAGGWILSLDDWRYRSPWYMRWKDLMMN